MPHLKLRNRYLHVAGDELSIPAICFILTHAIWTALVIALTAITFNHLSDCSNGWVLQVYLLATIGLCGFSIISDSGIIYTSLQGSILESEKRVRVGDFLCLKVLIIVLQLCFAGFGIAVLALGSETHCNQSDSRYQMSLAFVALVSVSQIIDSLFFMCCCYCLRSPRSKRRHRSLGQDQPFFQDDTALTVWESRCRWIMNYSRYLTCNLLGGKFIDKEGYEQVARVLVSLFHHEGFLDLVASDILAGLLLVRAEQRAHSRHLKIKAVSDKSYEVKMHTPRDPSVTKVQLNTSPWSKLLEEDHKNPEDSESITVTVPMPGNEISDDDKNAHLAPSDIETGYQEQQYSLEEVENWYHAITYALGIYTHLMAIYMHPMSGLCRISCGECMISPCIDTCSHACSPSSPDVTGQFANIEGDNCCSTNYYGMKVLTKDMQKNSELIHVSYKNNTRNKPYGIFLDHEKEWVVVVVRGTLSLEDCITDAICESVEMTEAGKQWGFDGSNRWSHEGFLEAALTIRKDIEDHQVLNDLYDSDNLRGANGGRRNYLRTFSHYRLIVVGHSLGAGLAILVAWLLRSKYPTLYCYAFGTPGAVLDEACCVESSSFVTSVVLGNDLVSRLNFPSLCRLRNDVLDAISRAKVNKMVVLGSIFKDVEPNDLMYARGEEPDSEFKQSVAKYKERVQQQVMKYYSIPMSLPGKIVHLMRIQKGKWQWYSDEPRYYPLSTTLHHFRELVVSGTMAPDHLPDQYFYEIKRLYQHYKRNLHLYKQKQ